jgi:hypothetical protein
MSGEGGAGGEGGEGGEGGVVGVIDAGRQAATAAEAAPRESTFVSERGPASLIAIYLALTTSVALAVSDLGVVVALAGAVAATTAIFIAPGACYCALHRTPSLRRTLAATLCASGCVLMPLLVFLVLAARGYLGRGWSLFSDDRE